MNKSVMGSEVLSAQIRNELEELIMEEFVVNKSFV